jgi:hypothetical protein
MSSDVSIADTVSDNDLDLLPGVDLTFFPLTDDDGSPVYPQAAADLIADLRAAGVIARTWHPEDQCEFVDGRNVLVDALLQVGVGIASSAGWYALQRLLRDRSGQVRVVVAYRRGAQRLRVEVAGDSGEVADVLRRIDPLPPPPSA